MNVDGPIVPGSNITPRFLKTCVGVLTFLAIAYTLFFVKSLLIPIVVALFFSFLLSPAVAGLKRLHIPTAISSILLVVSLVTPFTFLGTLLVEPAEKWVKVIPDIAEQLNRKLEPLDQAFAPADEPQAAKEPERKFLFFTLDSNEKNVPAEDQKQNPVSDKIAQGGLEAIFAFLTETPTIIAQVYASIILLLFFLIFGPAFSHTLIEVMPCFSDRDYARHFFEDTQKELSRYFWAIALINIGLGVAVGSVLAALGTEDPIFWATTVALLNFAPYFGPIIGMALLGLAGVVQYGPGFLALLPALVYFVANLIESQIVTPLVLGRHMRLNPLVVLLWLIVWGWLWGFVGLLLAVPLLVCVKLSLSRFELWPGWLKLIESPGRLEKRPDSSDA